ncbi:DNA-directed RNA polymerase subunit omega [Serpentinicella alkaliphila]|uniref:DNA-directed RNA polymerase subunit omega n=1 Tax=Serpentinicella alkaliphila TaxID=1734049 RepID=A0A4R2T9E1_9FIRM|nr:DNA-directed RNA polymerase subunit omega [Serpentinicella alkaliphila]QUH26130.1 DNA-directed RNA polymerase subunit omega [Serpentinicella alkaliphila]TCP98421.1 DNA-directed RNA polymerase subunit omega [Serpentinicella alkaliphila]
MLYPPINELLEIIDSRYTLVIATAKRARQLIDNEKPKVKTDSKKPVSIATQEIYEGHITYTQIKDDKK